MLKCFLNNLDYDLTISMSLEKFLQDKGVSEAAITILKDNEVDFEIFKDLTEGDLRSMFPQKVGWVRRLDMIRKGLLAEKDSPHGDESNNRPTENEISDGSPDAESAPIPDNTPGLSSKENLCLLPDTLSKQSLEKNSHFSQTLSHKLRNLRHAEKKKKEEETSSSSEAHIVGLGGFERDLSGLSVESAKEELTSERAKQSPNGVRLLKLFKYLHNYRREKILKTFQTGSVNHLIKEFPLLGQMQFIREEFKILVPKSTDAMTDDYNEMMRCLDIVFATEGCDDDNEFAGRQLEEIKLILTLQKNINERRVKSSSKPCRHAVELVDAHDMDLTTKPNDPPSLVVVRHEGGSLQAWILADGHTFKCDDAAGVLGYLLDIVSCYYAWDLDYPKYYAVFDFFQMNVVGINSGGKRSAKYLQIQKLFNEASGKSGNASF